MPQVNKQSIRAEFDHIKLSSQTNKDETTTAGGATSKSQKYNGERFANAWTKETIKILSVEFYQTCGEDLHNTPCQGHERHTKIDIVFEKVVNHVDANIKTRATARAKGSLALR